MKLEIKSDVFIINKQSFLKFDDIENNFSDMRSGFLTLKDGKTYKVKLIHVNKVLWIKLGQDFTNLNHKDKFEGTLMINDYKKISNFSKEILEEFKKIGLNINSISKRELRQSILFILESNSDAIKKERIKAFVESYKNEL
jgi:hypothetical protein